MAILPDRHVLQNRITRLYPRRAQVPYLQRLTDVTPGSQCGRLAAAESGQPRNFMATRVLDRLWRPWHQPTSN
jgi:hypothetical protein